MREIIERLRQDLNTFAYGQTMRDRCEAYESLKYAIMLLNTTIRNKAYSGSLSDPKSRSEFIETYEEFARCFNSLADTSGDLIGFYEENCRAALEKLDMMLLNGATADH